MSSDRINDLECAVERMSVTLGNVEEEARQLRKRVKQLENQLRPPRDDDDGRDDYERNRRDYDGSRSYSCPDDRNGERERAYYERNRRDREEERRLYARGNGSRDDDEYGRDWRDQRIRFRDHHDERDDYQRRDRH